MTDDHERSKDLKSLGNQGTSYEFDAPNYDVLETFENPMQLAGKGTRSTILITSPEFTSLCPKTGQPDYAKIIVEYVPRELCVESKSWKLYLNGYRNHGAFHEECCTTMFNHLKELLDPEELRVKCEFTPRGGIPFWPEITYSRPYEGSGEAS